MCYFHHYNIPMYISERLSKKTGIYYTNRIYYCLFTNTEANALEY